MRDLYNNLFIQGIEKTLRIIVGKDIFESFSDLEKSEFLGQIEDLENDGLINNTIKIRVRPGMVNMIRKLIGVDDIKGGAYRGDTVYLGSPQDLFNKDLITHESIHVKQQSELSKNKMVGFVKWLIYAGKFMKRYRKENKDNKYVLNESYVMIPTELEAYAFSDDPDYIKSGDRKAFEKYIDPKYQKEVLRVIENRNYKNEKDRLFSKLAFRELDKLEKQMKDTNDADWCLYIFNNIHEVNELIGLKKTFEKKLRYLDYLNSSDDKMEVVATTLDDVYLYMYEDYDAFREQYDRESYKFNFNAYLDDQFKDVDFIKKILKDIDFNIKKYQRASAKFWLEDRNNRDNVIEVGF